MVTFVSAHLEEEGLKRRRADALEVDSILSHYCTDPDQDPGPAVAGQLARCSQSQGWKFLGGEKIV